MSISIFVRIEPSPIYFARGRGWQRQFWPASNVRLRARVTVQRLQEERHCDGGSGTQFQICYGRVQIETC